MSGDEVKLFHPLEVLVALGAINPSVLEALKEDEEPEEEEEEEE